MYKPTNGSIKNMINVLRVNMINVLRVNMINKGKWKQSAENLRKLCHHLPIYLHLCPYTPPSPFL